MSDANPDDTGQISVAELLARNGQKTNLTAGGRRRRGVKGGISVAELTGEIPVVRDEPDSRSAPVVETPAAPAPEPETDGDNRAEQEDAPAFVSSRKQPAQPARPIPFQPVARRDKPQPEPELLSGSTTVAGDMLNRSHDDTERGQRPAAATTAFSERQPYGSTAAEQGRTRRSAEFQAPRQVEVVEPNTDVTPRSALIDVDDLAKTAVSARIQRAEDATSAATDKPTPIQKRAVPTVAETPENPETAETTAAETTAGTDTASDGDAESDSEAEEAKAPARAGRRAQGTKGKGGAVRQWLVLIGQAAVAIVVGALLFKGFEQLWDVLPWVALVLSVLVIVGLVAVVRILRRTDDLISIVIAIAVGVFVTLGPLAFQLSTG